MYPIRPRAFLWKQFWVWRMASPTNRNARAFQSPFAKKQGFSGNIMWMLDEVVHYVNKFTDTDTASRHDLVKVQEKAAVTFGTVSETVDIGAHTAKMMEVRGASLHADLSFKLHESYILDHVNRALREMESDPSFRSKPTKEKQRDMTLRRRELLKAPYNMSRGLFNQSTQANPSNDSINKYIRYLKTLSEWREKGWFALVMFRGPRSWTVLSGQGEMGAGKENVNVTKAAAIVAPMLQCLTTFPPPGDLGLSRDAWYRDSWNAPGLLQRQEEDGFVENISVAETTWASMSERTSFLSEYGILTCTRPSASMLEKTGFRNVDQGAFYHRSIHALQLPGYSQPHVTNIGFVPIGGILGFVTGVLRYVPAEQRHPGWIVLPNGVCLQPSLSPLTSILSARNQQPEPNVILAWQACTDPFDEFVPSYRVFAVAAIDLPPLTVLST